MNHYPFHIGDWTTATVGLSMLERGAYHALLNQYYANEAPLPLDLRERYRAAGATTKAECAAVDYVVSRFFVQGDDGWHNKRADEEIEVYRDKQRKASASASHRWNATKPDTERSAKAMRTHTERSAKAMLTNSQEPIAKNQEPEPKVNTPLPTVAHGSSCSTPPKSKTVAEPAKKPPAAPPIPDAQRTAARATWQAYSDAYFARYGTEPVRNAKVNRMVLDFVGRIAQDEAPQVAANFLRNNSAFYVGRGHGVEWLLKDAEKLRTEWATGRVVTATEARNADRTAANGQVFNRLVEEHRNGTEG